MNALLVWLLGLDPSAQILDLRLLFVVPIPLWSLVFVFLAIVWQCRRVYRRELADGPLLQRIFLTGLRVVTWCLVVFVVLQPRLEVDLLVEPKSNLAILIDDSLSMTLVDQQADQRFRDQVAEAVASGTIGDAERLVATTTPRWQIVEQILNNPRHALMDSFAQSYELHFFRFARDAESFQPIDSDSGQVSLREPPGIVTQLGNAMRAVPNRLRGLPMAGMVVFSDGQSNRGEDPEITARMLGSNKIPVFAVGIGATQAVDIHVMQVDIPDLLFLDDELSVRVTMQATGLDGVDIPIELTLGDKIVGRRSVVAEEGIFHRDIVITPKEVGDLEFIASVPQQEDEHNVDNNVLRRRIRVIDNAIRVLIACETPSWEYRYLKAFLASDKRIEHHVFLRRGDLRRARTDDTYLERFPAFEDLRAHYDVVILNNIGADYFSGQALTDLQNYVAEEGGGLVMIAATRGTPGTFANTPVGEMMPVIFDSIAEDATLDLADHFSRGFKLILTREGRQHIITRLNPLPDENAEQWLTLPDQFWYYTGIRRIKPTATSLVEHASARNSHGAIPLMAIHNFGRGQVLFLGFNTWRWRYRIGNRLTNRFWGQTIQYLGLPHLLGTMKRVNFLTEARDFMVGEPIPLTVRVLNTNYQPVSDTAIELLASKRDSEEMETFSLGRETDKEGVFTGRIFLQEGTWDIVVAGLESEDTLVIDSTPPQYEYMNTAMDENGLRSIAELSGGRFVAINEVGQLPEFIRATTRRSRTLLENSLWDNWICLLLIVCFAGLEWAIRRWIDLP